MTTTTQSPPLIAALMDASVYDHPVQEIRLVETHISWVILTGEFAYKIKKPVDLGFLDFSTLDKRRFYCEEELRLNRRLAPEIYLDVVPITGTAQEPVLGGRGNIIDYAVKMMEFPQDAQLDRLLMRGGLGPRQIDAVARFIADFHQVAPVAGEDAEYGEPSVVCRAVIENFQKIRECMQQDERLDALEDWNRTACTRLQEVFARRKANGFVRECHGDLHLRNLAWVDERPLAFDCIEFSEQLRWIDVMSEIAFLVMDLHERDQASLAWRFINVYLEQSGDYAGTCVLPFYLCYRAMVRAKVEAIRAKQVDAGDDERVTVLNEYDGYLRLADHYAAVTSPVLVVTRGVSASGKSTITQSLLEMLGAIRIRSDIERKRLFGIPADTDARSCVGQGIYDARASRQTYDRLVELAGYVLVAGFPVIVDAASLQTDQVAAFRALANSASVAFVILELTAPSELLRERIGQRERGVSDADRAVLEHQLSAWQVLPEEYLANRIVVDTAETTDLEALTAQIRAR